MKYENEEAALTHSAASRMQREQAAQMGSVNMTFLRNLWRIIQILIPSVLSKEVFYLVALGLVLVSRTMVSIRVSELTGKLVQAIVEKNYLKV